MEPIINLLQLGLDGAGLRQKALADNIANASTPDYKRKEVNFISTLHKKLAQDDNSDHKISLQRTDEGHLSGVDSSLESKTPFKQVRITDTSNRNDGNNVDVEVEMAELAKNNIYYNTLVQQINARFKNISSVIEKGGK